MSTGMGVSHSAQLARGFPTAGLAASHLVLRCLQTSHAIETLLRGYDRAETEPLLSDLASPLIDRLVDDMVEA